MLADPAVPRLALGRLAALPAGVARPAYDPATLPCGIVHLGIGAFHRAHQAAHVEDLLARRPGPWGITGVSLRRPDMRDRLAPQDGLYTLVERAPDGPRHRVIGCVRRVLVAPENPTAVIEALAAPSTRLVTLTITEKGYGLDPATRRLDPRDPVIAADLAGDGPPRGALGFLVAALARVRAGGGPPPTLLSCDNLPDNGAVLRAALVALAAARDPALAGWIERSVAIPSSMVDRIVPATTDADLAATRAALGVDDRAAVTAEPFRQWVIEDRVGDGFPDLGLAGAQLVGDVAAWERLKLRVLNASHSALAYLGQLAGLATIADTVATPLAGFVRAMVAQEIAPTLGDLPAATVADYAASVFTRFANPAIRHRTAQIAMDGSQKLPQRLLATVAARLRAGAPVDRLALAVAGWMRFCAGTADDGTPLPLDDPRAALLRQLASPSDAATLVDGMLRESGLFDADLADSPVWRAALIAALGRLRADGARAAAADLSGS